MVQLTLLADDLDKTEEQPEEGSQLWSSPAPTVQWSYSAHSSLRRCQLQYFYANKMAAHRASRDETRRQAFILGQLQDFPRWRGRLVDYAIEHFLVPSFQVGLIPPLRDVIERTIAVARKQWEFSACGRYAVPGISKGKLEEEFCALYAHEYGLPAGDAERSQVESEVIIALETLFRQADFLRRLAQLRGLRSQFIIQYPFERANIKAVLDLIGWQGPVLHIVDWKATESDTSDYSQQMLVYAHAAMKRWPETRAENVRLTEVRLLDDLIIDHAVNTARLSETEDFMLQSVFEMEALTQGTRYAGQDIEDYEPARTSRTCATCNFRKMCLQRAM